MHEGGGPVGPPPSVLDRLSGSSSGNRAIASAERVSLQAAADYGVIVIEPTIQGCSEQ
jgi:hypothetical protein